MNPPFADKYLAGLVFAGIDVARSQIMEGKAADARRTLDRLDVSIRRTLLTNEMASSLGVGQAQ